nr:hypothetical protein [Tanacetum cinerariifolium]
MSHHTLYGVKCLQDYAAIFKITRDDVVDLALRRNMGDKSATGDESNLVFIDSDDENENPFDDAVVVYASTQGEPQPSEEAKRLADLKVVKEKLEKALRRLNPSHRKAQERELVEIKAKINRTNAGYMEHINKRADEQPITKLEVHALASKKTRKRKRTREMIQQVFINEQVIMDGMERNLNPPQGITTRKFGQVLEHLEAGILYYIGNQDLSFQ